MKTVSLSHFIVFEVNLLLTIYIEPRHFGHTFFVLTFVFVFCYSRTNIFPASFNRCFNFASSVSPVNNSVADLFRFVYL